MQKHTEDPDHNLEIFAANKYPGRGFVIGVDETGTYFDSVYFLTGRSPNSRNRVFVKDGGTLRTAPADPSKVKDPSLIIYTAMREHGGIYIVSNGDQTDSVYEALRKRLGYRQALANRTYEPDAPNFTPRITGICSIEPRCVVFNRISKAFDTDKSIHQYFSYERTELPHGIGRCLTTYKNDGDPLPSFRGQPYPLPLWGNADYTLRRYWEALDRDNRVSIALKRIELSSGASHIEIINKYEQVDA